MRRSLRVALASLATLSLPFGTPAVHADPYVCSQPGPVCSPPGHCHAGDLFTIDVRGPGPVQGTASCGAAQISCSGDGGCGNAGVAADGEFHCDLSQGAVAICRAGAPSEGDPLTVVVCRTVGAVPLVIPLVNTVGGLVGLHVDPDDCDVWVAGERILDFPPIGD